VPSDRFTFLRGLALTGWGLALAALGLALSRPASYPPPGPGVAVGIVVVLAVGLSMVMSGFYRRRGDVGTGNRRDVLITLGVLAVLGLLAFLDWILESPISVFGMYCGAVYLALLDKTGGVRKFHWVLAFTIEAASILPLFGVGDNAADIAGELLVMIGSFVAVTGLVDHLALGRRVATAPA
jgi:hypothetical protein